MVVTALLLTGGGGGAGAAPAISHGGGQSSGDTTSPQPPSNADFSGHGANVHGPYDSTRDGSPSMNGNGNGKASGKPCAGCVGKADNKNPPGQLPGGSDPNAGYECDRNHGIGRSNPAHTGCTETPTSPPSSGETTPPRTPPSSGAPSSPVAPSSTGTSPAVVVVGPASTTPVAQVSTSAPALAMTGTDFATFLMLAIAPLLAGGAALMIGRRRRGQTAAAH